MDRAIRHFLTGARMWFFGLALAAIWVLALPPSSIARVTAAPAGELGAVMFIDHGLGVAPPHKKQSAGKVKEPLFNQYGLQTKTKQRAAIGFNDGTTMQMNQQTNAVLTDPHVIHVTNGEIALHLKPGSDHQLVTQAALATAIGTVIDLQIHGDDSTYIVVHGALQVSNKFGTVVVETNQETTAGPDHAPTTPTSVDGAAAIDWTAGMPSGDLGENLALGADGGQIVSYSSEDRGADHAWGINDINDGLLTSGWRSAAGKITNQSVMFSFAGDKTYRVTDVILDPAATGGNPSASDLRRFQVLISTTGTDAGDFKSVATGTCLRKDSLQDFHFATPHPARYIELVFVNNYGGTRYVEVAEAEIVATPM